MKLLSFPEPAPAGRTWAERLAQLGVTRFDTRAQMGNPFSFFARVLRLTLMDMAEALGVDVVVVELLVAGEASEVVEPVREGLRRQGLDPDEIATWYLNWLHRERAAWAA